jgi:predicted RNase H-like HicB family nuclease
LTLSGDLKLPYTLTLRRDEDGDWIARVQELPGCTADGPTRDAALADLDVAMREWLEAAVEHGITVPTPQDAGQRRPED